MSRDLKLLRSPPPQPATTPSWPPESCWAMGEGLAAQSRRESLEHAEQQQVCQSQRVLVPAPRRLSAQAWRPAFTPLRWPRRQPPGRQGNSLQGRTDDTVPPGWRSFSLEGALGGVGWEGSTLCTDPAGGCGGGSGGPGQISHPVRSQARLPKKALLRYLEKS